MAIQLLTDDNGLTTGVFIPMNDWKQMKGKYQIKEEERMISEAQFAELQVRIDDYEKNPDQVTDWDEVRDKYIR